MFQELFNLEGMAALVTGGSSGIGLEIARYLARAGVKVGIINRSREKGQQAAEEIKKEGGQAAAFAADVSRENQVEAAVQAAEEELGPLDILVNSHGINIRKDALDFELSEWQQIIDTNLTGAYLTCRTVGRGMVARKWGAIVNISSVVSLVGRPGLAPYSASKGGISQMTRTLAMEWAPYGVRVNAIGPGFIRTPLTEPLFNNPDFLKEVDRLIPLQRGGEPKELVGVALVLCSQAGSYITGQTIYVDGGWSIS
ncbi:MAG: SDR family oxidoreductase [Desulfarculaceae bacterium]|jgi:NAD(P)-dependent dehydrogenase (short-subunit alcohol dehydrogenase family)